MSPVEIARHRLEVLHADLTAEGPDERIVGYEERRAIRTVLDELHRLNLAVSEQAKTLRAIAEAKKKARQKPAAARSRRPTTRKTSEKR